MLDTLWTLLPFLVSVALLILWAGTILMVVVRWVIGQFKDGKVVAAAVALALLIVLPVGSGLLSRSFFNGRAFRGADSKLEVLSGLVDQLFGEDEEKDGEATSSEAASPEEEAPEPESAPEQGPDAPSG